MTASYSMSAAVPAEVQIHPTAPNPNPSRGTSLVCRPEPLLPQAQKYVHLSMRWNKIVGYYTLTYTY